MDYGYSIVQTPDEGFIAVGLKRIDTSPLMFAMRLNRFGDTIWTKTFLSNRASGIVELTDGNYVISGWFPHDPLIKIDLNGNLIWTKYNEAGEIKSSRDSGFFVNRNGVLKKFNDDGTVLWAFDFLKYMNSAELWGFGTFPGNEVLLIGVVHDTLPGMNRFILKVNKIGQFEFFRRFNSAYWPNEVVCPDSLSFVYSSTSGRSVSLIKCDLYGNSIWSKRLDTIPSNASTSLEDLVECNDKGFAMTGWYDAGDFDLFIRIIKSDKSGNLQWKRLYGFGDNDVGLCIRETRDSGFAVIGIRDNYNLGDIYIIKTDKFGYANPPVGISGTQQPTSFAQQNMKLYPNPFNSFSILEFDLHELHPASIRIYDIEGKEVKSFYYSELRLGTNTVRIDAGGLPTGIYFCKMVSNGSASIVKMLLIK